MVDCEGIFVRANQLKIDKYKHLRYNEHYKTMR